MLGQGRHCLALPVGGRAQVQNHPLGSDPLHDPVIACARDPVGDALDAQPERLFDPGRRPGLARVACEPQPRLPCCVESRARHGGRAQLVTREVESHDASTRKPTRLPGQRHILLDAVGAQGADDRHGGDRSHGQPREHRLDHLLHRKTAAHVEARCPPHLEVVDVLGRGVEAQLICRALQRRRGLHHSDRIVFTVAGGEAFGFLGPNGAGKTSTMRMIGGVSPVTAGVLTIFGLDPAQHGAQIRARLGVVPQADTLDLELTVRENLIIYARYFDLPWSEGRKRADELLEVMQLKERSEDKVDDLSGGMKRRLTIARGLINQPDLLLLDEPTTGLDPQARHLVWDRLYRLKQRGVTLVLTTHYMDEAEQLCDRLVVMDKARIAAEGSPRELIDRYSTREVLELRFPIDQQPNLDGKLKDVAERVEVLARSEEHTSE